MKEAVVILSAGIKNENGIWQTSDLMFSKNAIGAPGGRLRVLAGKYLYQKNPDLFIIASGGRGYDIENNADHNRPNLSSIIKKELIDLGVEEKHIIEEGHSNNSYQQFVNIAKLAKEKEINKLNVISNRYHLPRLKVMFKFGPNLENLYKTIGVKFNAAEDIVLNHDNFLQDIINQAYKSSNMIEIEKLEAMGIARLKNGTYKFN